MRDVSLSVVSGEPALLVGRNGAGKTTLLRIATGFMDPDHGDVAVDGVSMAVNRARAQAKLGYLPEQAPVPLDLIVRDHLRLRARLKGIDDVDAAVAAVLGTLAIEPQAGQRIGTLSKGYRQRVGLADALLGSPPLIVLDEPTGGMDPIQTKELCDHLIAIARDRAVLVSSHAVTELERLAARVVVMREGSIVADGTSAAVCARAGVDRLDEAVVKLLAMETAA